MTSDEFTPKEPTFFLAQTQKDYRLRIPKFKDIGDLTEICNGDLQELSKAKNWKMITRAVYYLMSDADRTDFLAKKKETVDNEGILCTEFISGPALLHEAIRDTEEATQIYKAVMAAIIAYLPVSTGNEGSTEKKSSIPLTGEKSLISSHPSMDTPPINSEISPTEKST